MGTPESSAPITEPTLDDIGRAGAYLLRHPTDWLNRLVETVVIESETTGRRRLTIDVELPRAPEAAAGAVEQGQIFYLPLTMLSRQRFTAEIDLADENGRVLPLLTASQNTEIAWNALSDIFIDENWHFDGFADELYNLLLNVGPNTKDDPAASSIAALILIDAMDENNVCAQRVENVIADLTANSILWVPLVGRPGERRIVKLSYPIAIRHPLRLYNSRSVKLVVEDESVGRTLTYNVRERAGLNLQRTAAATVDRGLASLGWAPYRTRVDFPQIRGAHSYHLQVVAPDGVDVGRIDCGGHAREHVVASVTDGRRAHLYIKDAEPAVGGYITCSYRPERRGFLNWALMATLVASAGLWFAQAHVPSGPKSDTDRQIVAAILLVLPALLVVLAVRQPEHPVATRLLSGVRALVMMAGLCSVVAAGALAGIQPGYWQSTSEDWIWCAAGATIAFIGVAAAWLSSCELRVFTDMHRERNGTHYFARTLLLAVGAGCAIEGVRHNILHSGESEPTAAFALLVLAVLLATNTVVNTPHRVRPLRYCSAAVTVILTVGAGAILVLDARLRTSVLGWLEFGLLLVVVLAATFALVMSRNDSAVRTAWQG